MPWVAVGRDVSEQYGKAGLVGHDGRFGGGGGDGVNIKGPYRHPAAHTGRRSQPVLLSIARFPDWTGSSLQIARQGSQGLIMAVNQAGQRVVVRAGAGALDGSAVV